MNKQSSQEGQILVILVLGIVALLGFTALALDGGLTYSERRHAQNSSDASSLAGGGAAGLVLDQVEYMDFTCGLASVTSARQAAVASAINRAASNDFAIIAGAGTDPNENEVTTECTVYDNGSYVEKYIDVKVKVGDDVQTALIHFVYKGQVRNVVDSVTRIYPRTPLAFGNAVVALSDTCQGNDGGVTFDGGGGGSTDIDINGGGIFSNACMTFNGGALDICVDETPGGPCNGDGDIGAVGTITENGGPSIDPAPNPAPEPMPTFDIPEPNCNSLPYMGQHMGGGAITPGRYDRIRLPNGNLTMAPGLYCLYGEFTINGGSLAGSDVTIFMANGDFSTGGNATTNLDAPPAGCDTSGGTPGCPPSIPGMLIYMAEGNPGVVSLAGSTTSTFEGVVYAPTGTIDVGGTNSTMPTINTQLVANTVNIHGNVDIDINYDDTIVFKLPATLDLYR